MYTLIYFFTAAFSSSLCLILDTSKKEDNSVNYFNHFRTDFPRPYGVVHDALAYDDSTISRRLNSYNCEFDLRPHFLRHCLKTWSIRKRTLIFWISHLSNR